MLQLEELETRSAPSSFVPSYVDGAWIVTPGGSPIPQATPAQVQNIAQQFAAAPVMTQDQLVSLESNFLQPGQGTVPPEMEAWDQPQSNGATFQQADQSAPTPIPVTSDVSTLDAAFASFVLAQKS